MQENFTVDWAECGTSLQVGLGQEEQDFSFKTGPWR